jgi:hypothetical protein
MLIPISAARRSGVGLLVLPRCSDGPGAWHRPAPGREVDRPPSPPSGTGRSLAGSDPKSPVAPVEMQCGIGPDGNLGSFHIQS